MQSQREQLEFLLVLTFSLFLTTQILSGCASTHKTTTTQTSVSSGSTIESTAPVATTQSQTTTKITESSTPSSSPGLIGGIFHAIGAIIAFPFKLIASIVEAIF